MQIVHLSADHPGFLDPAYRLRRNAIAHLASEDEAGRKSRAIEYSDSEESTWSAAWERLLPLHRRLSCTPIQEAQERLELWSGGIPQLGDFDAALASTGFSMQPVAGLVESRAFFGALAQGVFLSTQYVRHASRPFYTPEPDVIHELVGHAASLTVPEIAELSRAFGHATEEAPAQKLIQLERVYWYTLEFGAVMEGGAPRAVGAGLLSSVDEISSMEEISVRAWSPELLSSIHYDPTAPQPAVYVAPSWSEMVDELHRWLV